MNSGGKKWEEDQERNAINIRYYCHKLCWFCTHQEPVAGSNPWTQWHQTEVFQVPVVDPRFGRPWRHCRPYRRLWSGFASFIHDTMRDEERPESADDKEVQIYAGEAVF